MLDASAIDARETTYRDQGIKTVASWHSHPGAGLDCRPSSADVLSWRSWMTALRLEAFVGLILQRDFDLDAAWLSPSWHAFVVTPDTEGYRRMKVVLEPTEERSAGPRARELWDAYQNAIYGPGWWQI